MLGSQGHAVSGLGLGNSEARSRVCLQGQLLTEDSGRESFAMFLRMFLFPRAVLKVEVAGFAGICWAQRVGSPLSGLPIRKIMKDHARYIGVHTRVPFSWKPNIPYKPKIKTASPCHQNSGRLTPYRSKCSTIGYLGKYVIIRCLDP